MDSVAEWLALPIITAIVYMIIEVYKSVTPDLEKYRKIIPLIAMAIGMLLGILAYFISPEVIQSVNILGAIFIGGCNGLAATGVNQIFKQLKDKK